MAVMDSLISAVGVTLFRYLSYIVLIAVILVAVHVFLKLPQNVFRKLLHVAAFTSSIFVVLRGEGWLAEAITLALFAVVVYPVLFLAERWPGYGNLFVEKKPGEVKKSLLLLFLSQAVFVALTCGWMGKPWILIAATSAWGLGDIAAAWVGRPLGKHKIMLPGADHNKTWEGSAAMAGVAFCAAFCSLLLLNVYPLWLALIISAAVGVVSAFAEMMSKNGIDTVTVPAANILVLWLISLF